MKRSARHEIKGHERFYAIVKRIPRGRVATYGQIAQLAGAPGRARQVGYAMHALSSTTIVPWQRVVNANGGISLDPMNGGLTQRLLLEKEGVVFDARGRIALSRYQWRPRR